MDCLLNKINNLNAILSLKTEHLIGVIVSVALVFILFLILITILTVKAKNKKKTLALDKHTVELAQNICNSLGMNNITGVTLRNSRVELVLRDNSLIDKELLTSCNIGATLSGNTIKLMIKENAKLLEKEIKKLTERSTN